jgi:hypothetical protein
MADRGIRAREYPDPRKKFIVLRKKLTLDDARLAFPCSVSFQRSRFGHFWKFCNPVGDPFHHHINPQ